MELESKANGEVRILSGSTRDLPDNRSKAVAMAIKKMQHNQARRELPEPVSDRRLDNSQFADTSSLQHPRCDGDHKCEPTCTKKNPRSIRETTCTYPDPRVQFILCGYEVEGCSYYNGTWDRIAEYIQTKLNLEGTYGHIPIEHVFNCIPLKGNMSRKCWANLKRHTGFHWTYLKTVWNHEVMPTLLDRFLTTLEQYREEHPLKTFTAVFVCRSGIHRSVAVSHGLSYLFRRAATPTGFLVNEHRSQSKRYWEQLCGGAHVRSFCSLCDQSEDKDDWMLKKISKLVLKRDIKRLYGRT